MRQPANLVPNTTAHFVDWAAHLVLDNGDPWVVEDFQAEFVTDFFDGRWNECWLIVPEGNAKTTLVAGLTLYHCQFTRWARAAVAASSRDQAQMDWDAAEGFVTRSELAGFTCHPGLRRIRYRPGGSELQVWAADARTGDGIIPTLTVLDELHRHRDLKLYRTWRGKLRKRGGVMVAISTAGEPGSEFEQTRDRIRQQAEDATRELTFTRATSKRLVMHEYAVPQDGDVEDLDLVKAANPLSAITVESLREVRNGDTMTLAHWRRMNCNLATRSEASAITEAEWFAQVSTEAIPDGEPVWLGLDVAWKWDTTAMVPLWIRDPHFHLFGPATVLVPPRDGTSLDPTLVESALATVHARNPIHTVVMDETRAEQLAEWIRTELGATVVPRPQTNPFAALDFERFMEGLRQGWLHHAGDPGLTRHALNAIARPLPGGGARFDRPHQSRLGSEADMHMRVIDALSAAAMAYTAAVAELGAEERKPMVAWV